jgi:hypothetical protein
MPTDAPESRSAWFARGGRGAVLAQDPPNPARQTQARVDPRHVCIYFLQEFGD